MQLRGRTLCDHARATIESHVDAVVIVCPDGVPDSPRPGLDPLEGLAGALHALTNGFDAVVTTVCDTPILPRDLVRRFIAALPAFVIEAPVVGCWPAAVVGKLEAPLEGEDRSMRSWARACGALGIAGHAPLFNINYREDLEAAMLGMDP